MNKLAQRPKFSTAIQTETYQKLINNTLKDPTRANKFVADIMATVSNNPTLQDCEAGSVLASGFIAESLKLSMSPSLGHCYLVPYDVAVKDENGKNVYKKDENGNILKDDKGKWVKETVKKAQFQMGYKGLVQLAVRSGQYRNLIVIEVKDGEFINYDPFTEEIKLQPILDEELRAESETVGYYAVLEYLNGFRKAIYWTKEKMLFHADKYSAAFSADEYHRLQNGEIADKDMWKYSSFWYKNFDDMAKKTMLRQLISKWGVMSIEFQTAMERDMAVIEENGNYIYADNPQSELPTIDTPQETTPEVIETTPTTEISIDEL